VTPLIAAVDRVLIRLGASEQPARVALFIAHRTKVTLSDEPDLFCEVVRRYVIEADALDVD
jgi:hypothetical protein